MGFKKSLKSLTFAFAATTLLLGADMAPPVFGGTFNRVALNDGRSISLYNTHTEEAVRATYYKDGAYDGNALTRINNLLRDHRQGTQTTIDTDLLDLLHDIEQELNRRYPGRDIVFHVISGYRSPATNAMLRRNRGGQGKYSRHMHGDAIDIRVPGVTARELRDIAWCQGKGGVGYYPKADPRSNYIHIDTYTKKTKDNRYARGERMRAWGWQPTPGMCGSRGNS